MSISGFDVDIAFYREKVFIEIDGWAWHSDSKRRSHDLARQNALVNAGWTPLRFDWHRLAHDSEGVVADMRVCLA